MTNLVAYLASVAHGMRDLAARVAHREVVRFRHPSLVLGAHSVLRNDAVDALRIGEDVGFGPFCEIVVIRRSAKSAVPGLLTIGKGTYIGAFANIRAAGGSIEIGENCLIGQHVSIVAANHGVKAGHVHAHLPYDQERTGVRIGSNAWIGAGVVLLPGTSVGDNSIVAAGAVVTRDVPADEIWGNIPARRIGAVGA